MEPESSLPHSQVPATWASSVQFMPPHPTSWRSILLLSSHLRLGLSSVLVPSLFPDKTLYTSLLSTIRATFLAHHILPGFITRTMWGEQHISLGPHCVVLLHSPVTSSLLGPNVLLNTSFSNTLILRSFLKMSDPVPSIANITFQNISFWTHGGVFCLWFWSSVWPCFYRSHCDSLARGGGPSSPRKFPTATCLQSAFPCSTAYLFPQESL